MLSQEELRYLKRDVHVSVVRPSGEAVSDNYFLLFESLTKTSFNINFPWL